jgi:hypothetical protein
LIAAELALLHTQSNTVFQRQAISSNRQIQGKIMDSETVQPVKRRPYWSFIALNNSLLGWGLFEAWLFSMTAGFIWHIFAAISGATLVIRSALRPSIDHGCVFDRNKGPLMEARSAKLACPLLFIMGAIIGAVVLDGSSTLLGVIVAAFTFAPWSRLHFTRDHMAISCAATVSGLLSVTAIGYRSIDVMSLPFAAWTFWGFACCALLFRAEHVRLAKQLTTVATKTGDAEPHPIHSPG